HAFYHGLWWRCAGHHALDPVGNAHLELVGGIDQQAVHDGCPTIMVDTVLAHGREDQFGVHPAQTDIDTRACRHGPGEAPAIAVEHGQCPQINGVGWHVPFENVRNGSDGCTAM